MPVKHIHTYLVHPGKGDQGGPTKINGATVPLDGSKLFRLLDNIYSRSDVECDIDIAFAHNARGHQQNDCRDLVTNYLGKPTLANGRKIANRLQQMSDHRSGLGLLFLISGREGQAQNRNFPISH